MAVSIQPGVLQKIRAEKALTQEALAAKAGLSPRTLQKIEAGRPVSAATVHLLAEGCEVDVGVWLGTQPSAKVTAVVERNVLEVHIRGDYDIATFASVMAAFNAIKASLPDGVELRIIGARAGSVILTVEVAAPYAESLLFAIWDGKLEEAGAFDAELLTNPSVVSSGRDKASTHRRSLTESPSAYTVAAGATDTSAQTGAGQIISVLGSRGGVGCTSLAVNLAATLAADPTNTVALIDLDLAMGDADIALELPGNGNISMGDLARNIERLDMNYLKRALVRHPDTGLSILRHPLEIHEIAGIHEGHVERILNLLKISYSHLVLDLSKSMLPTDLMALRMSNLILLVAQLELSSLRNVVRLIHSLSLEGDMADRLRVVLNRAGSEHLEDGITVKKAEEVIGKPIFWQLPNDAEPMIGYRVSGQPLIKSAPKSKLQQSIRELTQAIIGNTDPVTSSRSNPSRD
jgi:pilus assembly protein CpaE